MSGAKMICSDYAVTDGKNDFTEHGVWSLDSDDNMYAIDWFYKQCDTGVGLEAFFTLVDRWRIQMGFNEGGVIDKAIRPAFITRMRDWNAKASHEKVVVESTSISALYRQCKTRLRKSPRSVLVQLPAKSSFREAPRGLSG